MNKKTPSIDNPIKKQMCIGYRNHFSETVYKLELSNGDILYQIVREDTSQSIFQTSKPHVDVTIKKTPE